MISVCGKVRNVIDNDERFVQNIVFSDEAAFHVCRHVRCHNVQIRVVENPHAYIESERNTPKVNVWCVLMYDKEINPFFFVEKTVTLINYLDMLECMHRHTFQKESSSNKTALLHIMPTLFVRFWMERSPSSELAGVQVTPNGHHGPWIYNH